MNLKKNDKLVLLTDAAIIRVDVEVYFCYSSIHVYFLVSILAA